MCHFNVFLIKFRSQCLNFNLFWINRSPNTLIVSHMSHNLHHGSNRSHGNTRSQREQQVTREHQVTHGDPGHGVRTHVKKTPVVKNLLWELTFICIFVPRTIFDIFFLIIISFQGCPKPFYYTRGNAKYTKEN